jgi:hypothetical protein
MNFNKLCDIVLEGKKEKYARLVIGNDSPVFSIDDVLKDPSDPSKGLRTYLTHRDSKSIGDDHERLARRAVRRINWVAKAAIKKLGQRELSIDKLNDFIIKLLEQYQTKVLGNKKPDKLRTTQEARIIGNLLLPPTKWTPQAKSVFIASTEAVPGEKKVEVDDEQLAKDFNNSAEGHITLYDPDLIQTIRDIVNGVSIGDGYDIAEEGMEDGVSVSQILKDPRIKNIYDSATVRKVIKNMIELGALEKTESGNLIVPAPGEEQWRKEDQEKDEKTELEDVPTEDDMEDMSDDMPSFDTGYDADDEEDYLSKSDWGDDTSSSRLGYGPDDEDDEEDSWY